MQKLLAVLIVLSCLFPVGAEDAAAGKLKLSVALKPERPFAFLRMSGEQTVGLGLENKTGNKLSELKLKVKIEGKETVTALPELEPEQKQTAGFGFDTSLRPGAYPCSLSVIGRNGDVLGEHNLELYIAPRPTPDKMPVIMWSWGNPREIQACGFTHSLLYLCDNDLVQKAGKITQSASDLGYGKFARLLDQELIDGFRAVGFVGTAHYLNANQDKLLRVDRKGKVYSGHKNVCALFPEVNELTYLAGASMAQTFAKFPAFDMALVETEVRDFSNLCFHQHDRDAYKVFSGHDIPDNVVSKRGFHYSQFPKFPKSRLIRADYPPLQYLRWFWQVGDGWNEFMSSAHRGLQTGGRHITTWFDPALRAPSLSGSGGEVDFISQWTYSYPDPIKIGKVCDELQTMASLSKNPRQRVMNMTQIIWYRAPTAPKRGTPKGDEPPLTEWEKEYPDTNFITIAPDHLSEAFWSEISRQVDGIMYHGWRSLVDREMTVEEIYRCTNDQTRETLKGLIDNVITPLGPTLRQIPEIYSDVAFLQSFTSEMFAGKGEYGWGSGWGNDAYLILRYANLQPRVVYEESILKGALKRTKILVATNCPVLTKDVAAEINQFQRRGGVVIGDQILAPGITSDIIIKNYDRKNTPREDKQELQDRAVKLSKELRGIYRPYSYTDNCDLVTRVRRSGSSDYLFLINDNRTYGDYVGQFGLVMEKGLPARATVGILRKGYVYDLVKHQPVAAKEADGKLSFPVELGPGEGKLYLVTSSPLADVELEAPNQAVAGQALTLTVKVLDEQQKTVAGVVPVELRITDPAGKEAEFSGFYGASNGSLQVTFNLAKNDTPGEWKITARELASLRSAEKTFTLTASAEVSNGKFGQ